MELRTFIRELFRGLHDWQARRDAVRHLRGLNDHLLRDIGIERDEIETVVHGMMTTRSTDRAHRWWQRQGAAGRVDMVPAA